MLIIQSRLKGSYNVEYSMVMPLVVLCLFFLILMNLYLHDEVIMNGVATEAVYSGMTKEEMSVYVNSVTDRKRFYLPKPVLSYEQSMVSRMVSWKSSFSLPLGQLMGKTSATMKGGCKRYPWNMTQVLRIKSVIET